MYVEDFTASPQKWIPGKIVEVTGPLSLIALSFSMAVRFEDMLIM